MKSVLFDVNNLCHRCLFSDGVLTYDPENKKKVVDTDWNMWRYRVFDSIFQALYKVRDVKEIICACDNGASWRKELWERYKEHRSEAREKLEFDWAEFFNQFDQFMVDISNHIPFKVLRVNRAEADDIIGVICLHMPQECHIISTDRDFLQLCSSRVKIYNPLKKENMTCPNPEMFIVEQSLMGQAKDNIWNVKTPLDYPLDKRKPGLGEKTVEKIVALGYKKWLTENGLEERYEFNRNLIDLGRIPQSIVKKVLLEYKSVDYPKMDKIYEFFKRHGWNGYLDEFQKVESMLLKLY